MVKLNHIKTKQVFDSGFFNNITCYNELEQAIIKYADVVNQGGVERTREVELEYYARLGEAFEVYTEFFFSRFGVKENPLLNITNIKDTSSVKMNVGYDFTYKDIRDNLGHIQSKFSHIPIHTFTRKALGTFVSMADEDGVPANRRVLFTNLYHKPGKESNGIFDVSYIGGLKQMRVIGRIEQETFIERDETFWNDFVCVLRKSSEPIAVNNAPPPRQHQQEAMDAINKLFAA